MVEVFVKEKSVLARIAAARLKTPDVAVVIGRTIFLHGANKQELTNNTCWLLHELTHIEQYKRMGILPFLCRYTWYSIKYGYYNNPLEKEARENERNHGLLNKYAISSK